MPKHIVKHTPPQVVGPNSTPSERMGMAHPTSKDMIKGAPDAISSLKADSFTTDQPSGGVDVKSGQGPI